LSAEEEQRARGELARKRPAIPLSAEPQPAVNDRAVASQPVVAAPPAPVAAGPGIPDHQLLCRVGKGAYGEVWLARSAIGTFHAVKVVHRSAFPNDAPFEREFNGLRKFTPISRSHPGFVHILHVGRHDATGCLYYVMEVADDEFSGQKIDPLAYSPKTLAKELKRRKRLPLDECLRLGAELATALDVLHQQQLIHRDIKPANIIFVRGAPKLADIGLVTEEAEAGGVSNLGTEGYIPPEGPGTAAGDVYSLGKVLYEASAGLRVNRFPEVPPELVSDPREEAFFQLNAIVLKACEHTPAARFPSAAALHDALVDLRQKLHSNNAKP
jgi:serine/threonine protein kinase